MSVRLRANARRNATQRSSDEPAPTITGGHDSGERVWIREREREQPEWCARRPATTVVADPRQSGPGVDLTCARQDREGGVRLSVSEGAVLQGFSADYPFCGNQGQQWEQVGNAIPPPLAAGILRSLTTRVDSTSAKV